MFRYFSLLLAAAAALSAQHSSPTPNPKSLYAFPGGTPALDGVLEKGEWEDATQFFGVRDWVPQFSPTTDPRDLSLHGYVKHDDHRLYFAFDITDDVLYGIDTPRWLPHVNPKAHELTPKAFPGSATRSSFSSTPPTSGRVTNPRRETDSTGRWCAISRSHGWAASAKAACSRRAAPRPQRLEHLPQLDRIALHGVRRPAQTRGKRVHYRVGGEFRSLSRSRARQVLFARHGRPSHGTEHCNRRSR